MTEYDYSPEGYKRHMETQQRISRWVNDTNSHSSEFKTPFGPRSDVSREPVRRSPNPQPPAPRTIRPRAHEYHGSTSGSGREGGSDVKRSSSVHRPSPRNRTESTESASTVYYDPDGPGPMPMRGPSYPLRAAVPGIPTQHLVDGAGASRNQSQTHSRHASHGNRPNVGNHPHNTTTTRGRALPTSGLAQALNIARSSSLPRPYTDARSGSGYDHHPHHSSNLSSNHHHHHHHHPGHHHHHHHHHRPRSRSTGPSISHSASSGTTYEISSPTFIAPALGKNRPLVVPYSPGDRGYYAPKELLMSDSGYTIIPQRGTMVKVVL